ncbi:uncharacterized protein LOC119074322 [Bradysia coprophila]|uniref:uncharacterized protein LOC119074322 n=1 Tax=Bradysia coprophila TaxID=38358 RepID=UPI00187DA688|nr:uncharacterized protein LOC119074322 [Bradysia coprophila]
MAPCTFFKLENSTGTVRAQSIRFCKIFVKVSSAKSSVMALNKNMNSKIMDLMMDLVNQRDGSIGPQNFTVYLAKTTTENKKINNRSIESENVSHRPQNLSERSPQNSTSEARGKIPRLSRKSTHQPNEHLVRQLNVARNATTHSSQLPLTLEHPNDFVPPKIVPIRKTDPRQIAAKIESQRSNVRLTSAEREALISRILTNELEIQSKLAAQAKEIFSSPKTEPFQRQTVPSKQRKNNDEPVASLMEKRLQIESIRAAQERLLFSPTSAVQRETRVVPPTFDITSDSTTPTEKNRLNHDTSRSRPRLPVGSQTRQAHQNFGRALTPIPETSEPRDSARDKRNSKGNNRNDMESILGKEKRRQQHMESRLPSELIQDIETSLLLQCSDESDSLEDLVIKDFAIRIAASEADPATSSLPVTEQVILESNKLKEMIESVKDRFQIKVARDKFAERDKQNKRPPDTRMKVPAQGIVEHNGNKSQTLSPTPKNDKTPSTRTKPVNILDSHNWGNVALPQPLFTDDVSIGPSNSGMDETVLSERDMQFDDLFGVDNVSEPVSLRDIPQHQPPLNNGIIGQSQRNTEPFPDSIGNIEDLESPRFSDLPSDVSVPSIREKYERLEDLEDPQHSPDETTRGRSNALKQPQINIESPKHRNGIELAVVETEHEKDIAKLKELIDSGALTSSIMNERFEEGVLDLLLRQTDSLWDPVDGIPIIYFIPSRNYERGLLDTSIKESNLGSPLIKQPEDKLPEFMASLENEWTTNIEKNDDDAGIDDNNIDFVENDESVLLPGIPKFSYKPAPEYLYRKTNIMDSKDESVDDYDILDDQEMNFDDLIDNAAEPTYDFQKAKIMDDLEIKMRIIRRMAEKRTVASEHLRLPRNVGIGTDKSSPNNPSAKQSTQNQWEPVRNPVKIRKSVSFANSLQDIEASKHDENVRGNDKSAAASQKNIPESSEIKRWTTLTMAEVKDLIEHARLAQAKRAATKNSRIQ